MLTEQQNPNSQNIDQLSTLEVLQVINDEDAKVAFAIHQALPALAEAVEAISARLREGGRLIYVGAGTSGRLGVLDAVELVPTYGISSETAFGILAGGYGALMRSVEGAEDQQEIGKSDLRARNLNAKDAVVGIAASGRTPYVLGAIETANETGCLSVGISCNVPSPLLDLAQIKIGVEVGPEVITGSTRMKAGTAQKLILNMMSTACMVKLGKVYGNLMVDVQVTNQKLADRACRIVAQIAEVNYEQANALLIQSDNNVKRAIVMHKRQVSLEEAKKLLEEAEGRLSRVIG